MGIVHQASLHDGVSMQHSWHACFHRDNNLRVHHVMWGLVFNSRDRATTLSSNLRRYALALWNYPAASACCCRDTNKNNRQGLIYLQKPSVLKSIAWQDPEQCPAHQATWRGRACLEQERGVWCAQTHANIQSYPIVDDLNTLSCRLIYDPNLRGHTGVMGCKNPGPSREFCSERCRFSGQHHQYACDMDTSIMMEAIDMCI